MSEVVVSSEEQDNGVEAVQAAAALAAAEKAGEAGVKADIAGAKADEAHLRAEAAEANAAAAGQVASSVASSQITPEEVDARVEDKLTAALAGLVDALKGASQPPAPAPEKPRDQAPKGIEKQRKKTFADRWYGRAVNDD